MKKISLFLIAILSLTCFACSTNKNNTSVPEKSSQNGNTQISSQEISSTFDNTTQSQTQSSVFTQSVSSDCDTESSSCLDISSTTSSNSINSESSNSDTTISQNLSSVSTSVEDVNSSNISTSSSSASHSSSTVQLSSDTSFTLTKICGLNVESNNIVVTTEKWNQIKQAKDNLINECEYSLALKATVVASLDETNKRIDFEVTAEDGTKNTYTFEFEIEQQIDNSTVSLSVSNIQLNVGEEGYIGDCVSVTGQTTLSWASDDCNVATVEDGFIKAINVGFANVSVFTANGNFATCVVTVGSAPASLFKLNYTSTSLLVGNTLTLNAVNEPNRILTFSSSDSSILTVSTNGVVTGVKSGYAKITATDSFGNVDYCYILVVDNNSEFVVDGNVSEWFNSNTPKYQGQTLKDVEDTVRTVTVFSVLRKEGIYFAGEAIHTTTNEDYSTWHWNTNFEVFVTRGTTQEQKWIIHNNNAPDVVGSLNTTKYNSNYKTTFEMFIPYEIADFNNNSVARIGWAFKNRGELIKVARGESFEFTDWWWADSHTPNVMSEHWYVYPNGMYGNSQTYYTQNFNSVANGALPSDWNFSINSGLTTCSAEVTNGKLHLTSTGNNPVVTLNYIPTVSNYAVEFDMNLISSTNATRWTGLVFDYVADDSYWQAVVRQNGNVNVDRWLISSKTWSPTNDVTTTLGSLTYNTNYHIRVEFNGNVVTYFVNNTQYAQVTLSENRRANGKLGFSCASSEVYFDNFVIKALEA